MPTEALLVLLGLGAVWLPCHVAVRRARRRHAAITGSAAAAGWTYTPRDRRLARRWPGPPFGRGTNRRCTNVLTGRLDGAPAVAFDYSYDTHATDPFGVVSTTRRAYVVCAVALPAPLPSLAVVPRGRLSGADRLLRAPVEVESEAFNRRFRIRCADPRLASTVLVPRTVEMLLHCPTLAWRVVGATLLCWEPGRLEVEELPDRLATLAAIRSGIPGFAWDDAEGAGARPSLVAAP